MYHKENCEKEKAFNYLVNEEGWASFGSAGERTADYVNDHYECTCGAECEKMS